MQAGHSEKGLETAVWKWSESSIDVNKGANVHSLWVKDLGFDTLNARYDPVSITFMGLCERQSLNVRLDAVSVLCESLKSV